MTAMTLSARVERDHGSAARQGQRTRSSLRSVACLLVLLLGAANSQASSVATEAIFANGFQAPAGPIAPGDISIEIASHWGGPILAADIQGNYAYIANGRMFRILDISDETNPVEVGALALETGPNAPSGVYDVKVRGGYAFVAGEGEHFFNVVDVSDPTAPSLVRAFARPPNQGVVNPEWIALSGDHAYVFQRGGGVHIYRIADPANVSYSASLDDSAVAHLSSSIAINNGYLFVGGRNTDRILYVYDLSNPTVPVHVSTLVDPAFRDIRSVLVVGDYLYAAAEAPPNAPGGRYKLLTIDISDPTAPFLTDEHGNNFSFAATVPSLAASDGRLYVINQTGSPRSWTGYTGLYMFDIAQTPESPVLLDTYRSLGHYGAALAAAPARVYLWDTAEGLVILDVADPAEPRPLGRYHSPSGFQQILADGAHLYVSDFFGGFTVLDVADASQPRVLGRYLFKRHDDVTIKVAGIDKVGDIVYLAAGSSGLLTVDVSSPTRPHTLGAMRISSMAFPSNPWCGAEFQGLKVRDHVVYLGYLAHFCASADMYLLAVDVTDPFAPAAVGVESVLAGISSPVHSIAVGDGIVAAGGRMTLHADSPTDPQLLHGPAFSQLISDTDFAIHESFRLIIVPEQGCCLPPGTTYGLNIQDISAPSNPVTVSNLTIGESMHALSVQHDSHRVYLRSQQSVLAVDISDPAAPVEIHRLTGFRRIRGSGLAGGSVGLLVDEPRLYATDYFGLTVLNVHDAVPDGAARVQQGN